MFSSLHRRILVNGFGEVRSEARRTESGGGVLDEGSQPPPHQLKGLGSAVSSPSGVWGDAPAAKAFSRILNTQDNFQDSKEILIFLLPGRVVGPEVGPERKWQGLGPTLSI